MTTIAKRNENHSVMQSIENANCSLNVDRYGQLKIQSIDNIDATLSDIKTDISDLKNTINNLYAIISDVYQSSNHRLVVLSQTL